LVLDLDHVVADPDDQVGPAQQLTLHLAPRPLDAAEGQRMGLVDHALGHRGRRERRPMAIDHRAPEAGVPRAHARAGGPRDGTPRGRGAGGNSWGARSGEAAPARASRRPPPGAGTGSVAGAVATSSGRSRCTGPSGSLSAISTASASADATRPSRSGSVALVMG